MRGIIDLVLAAAAVLAAIAPALADPRPSADCLAERQLSETANAYKSLVEIFQAALSDPERVEAENKYFARFDAENTVTLIGTVKEFQFSSPRARIMLNVPNGEGQPAIWAIEMNSPSGLVRLHWSSKTLTPGMPVTLTIHPLRDGSNGGQFLTATLPNGRQMDGGPPSTLKNRLQTLRDQAAAADRALAEFRQRSGCDR